MRKPIIGVLLMAYGTPRSTEEIAAYYTHIRRGRKPPEHLLTELQQRYEAVGEINRFAQITNGQVENLVRKLNQTYPAFEFRGYLGLKHIDPFIEDAVTQMAEEGVENAISLVLAPHYSSFSVKVYNERAAKKSRELGGPTINSVDSWYDEPLFIAYWAEQIKAVLASISATDKDQSLVIFSAHSLPEKILQTGDPYPEQLATTAKLIAEKADIPHYTLAWQSAGRTPEPWLGPDVRDITRDMYQKGYRSFIYCPIGFVAEHLEVLYDNDIECKAVTDELGAAYYRPPMPNDDPRFINCLHKIVSDQLAQLGNFTYAR